MVKEDFTYKIKSSEVISTPDVSHYLALAKRSYENYLINNSEGDIDISITSYEKAIEIDPNNAEAHYKLAGLLWEKGCIDVDNGIYRCQKAIELDPACVESRLFLGYFYKAADRLDDAITEFNIVIEKGFFNSAKARIAKGICQLQKAKTTSKKVLLALSGLYNFVFGVFFLVYDRNSISLVLRSLLEEAKVFKYSFIGKILSLLGSYNNALNTYEDAINATSRMELFYESIGDLHKKNNNYPLAANYYRKSIHLNPKEEEGYQKLISVLDEETDTMEIIDCYKTLTQIDPGNKQYYYSLGHTYLEDSNHFGAIECFKKAIELEPENAFYHNSLAYALVQVDDFDGAINEYQKALNCTTDATLLSIVCQALAAIFYQAKENAEAAIMAYQMALSYDPECAETLISLAEIYYDKGNLGSAEDCYIRTIKIEKGNAQAFCNLGFVYWEMNETTKAIHCYKQAIKLHNNYDIAYNNLGVAYLDGVFSPDKALTMFESAIKHNPNYALAYYNKARTLEVLGKKTEAASFYQMALDINTLTNELNPDEITEKLSRLFKVE